MTLLLDRLQTSSAPPVIDRGEALATGLLVDAAFGTSAGVPFRSLRSDIFGVTTVPRTRQATSGTPAVADEVRTLRDAISATGVSRQQLARLVGVDRRSLSGWASGGIRPGPERLEALRTVAHVIAEMETERPGRVPELLTTQRGTFTLLDAVAAGRTRLELWRWWVQRAEANPTVVTRLRTSEPIWAAAAAALAAGRLSTPAREPVVRAAEVYEINPEDEAAAFAEPQQESGRRGYR